MAQIRTWERLATPELMAQRKGGGDAGAFHIFIRGFRVSGGKRSGRKPHEASSGNHRAEAPTLTSRGLLECSESGHRSAGSRWHRPLGPGSLVPLPSVWAQTEASQRWRQERRRRAGEQPRLLHQLVRLSISWWGGRDCVCAWCPCCAWFSLLGCCVEHKTVNA